ncbi:MAG TPA: tetratricopeptide repeat protein [Steroidobacteraceae bacterium]|jgi:tetratricopeptide (TPR) repeat protein
MTVAKKLALLVALGACAALPDSAAQAAGTGPAARMPEPRADRQISPEQQATTAYNSGVKQINKAADYEADAAKAGSPEKRDKALQKASASYQKALDYFRDATSLSPSMYQAWNYAGFAERHLGHYDDALNSYAQALRLKPDFVEAIEYRAEAYLGLNRLDDARQAYMQLFSASRKHADQLLAAMQKFVAVRRTDPAGLQPQALDEFAKWVQERGAIAQQTASLDTSTASTSWH